MGTKSVCLDFIEITYANHEEYCSDCLFVENRKIKVIEVQKTDYNTTLKLVVSRGISNNNTFTEGIVANGVLVFVRDTTSAYLTNNNNNNNHSNNNKTHDQQYQDRDTNVFST